MGLVGRSLIGTQNYMLIYLVQHSMQFCKQQTLGPGRKNYENTCLFYVKYAHSQFSIVLLLYCECTRLSGIGGLDCWTGILDWNTGMA